MTFDFFFFFFTWCNKGSIQNSSLSLYLDKVPATWIGLLEQEWLQKFPKHGMMVAEASAL